MEDTLLKSDARARASTERISHGVDTGLRENAPLRFRECVSPKQPLELYGNVQFPSEVD